MKRKQLLSLSALPNSLVEPLHITSLETGQYNCISWALGITDFPIWPIDEKPYNWPSNLPLIESMENFITFFKMHGFEYCENEKPKKDFELIAIFEKDGLPTGVLNGCTKSGSLFEFFLEHIPKRQVPFFRKIFLFPKF
jgi:hypothetical protein